MDQVKNIKLYALKTTKVILIGSKCDDIEHRKLTYEEIKQFADNVGFPYIETSAKENTNIEKAVDMLVVSIERDIGEIESDRQKNLNPSQKNSNHQRHGRCIVRIIITTKITYLLTTAQVM